MKKIIVILILLVSILGCKDECVKACCEGNKYLVEEGYLHEDELRLNCVSYCSSYANESDEYADEG